MNSRLNRDYYVYFHVGPYTKEIVYIGHGRCERAWICRTSGPGRSLEHADWCDQLMKLGRTPDEWVQVRIRGLSKDEARNLEQQLIKEHKPRFNKKMGTAPLLTKEQVTEARALKDIGWTYKGLKYKFNVSEMTLCRAINGVDAYGNV